MNNPAGFTFLEAIITLGVIAIIFSLSGPALTHFQRSLATSASDREILHILSTANRKARYGLNGTPWGVYIPYNESSRSTDRVIIFCGTSYATRDPDCDDVYTVSKDILFISVDFSGAAPDTNNDHEVVFNVLSGTTTGYGSLAVQWYDKTRTLSVTSEGFINRQ